MASTEEESGDTVASRLATAQELPMLFKLEEPGMLIAMGVFGLGLSVVEWITWGRHSLAPFTPVRRAKARGRVGGLSLSCSAQGIARTSVI